MDKGLQPLAERIDAFVAAAESLSNKEAEEAIQPILRDLLAVDGYELGPLRPSGYVTDLAATNRSSFAPTELGIEYKHYENGRPVDVGALRVFLGAAASREIDRLLVISRSPYTTDALELAQRQFPIEVELMTIGDLRGWVGRLISASQPRTTRIASAILAMARELARAVAADPTSLDEIEWRDLERMLGAVLDELGFDAEVTPPSKDGGKDIVLRLHDRESDVSWAVEVKHWRSGQRVGQTALREFVEVIARESHKGGLFLATHGYTQDAFGALSEVERRQIRLGSDAKVLSLCRTFVKAERGLWSPPADDAVEQLLFDATLTPPPAAGRESPVRVDGSRA